MSTSLGVIMDPIRSIKIHKDSTFAMLLEAQARGWQIFYMEQADLFLRDTRCHARTRSLEVQYSPQPYGRGILCVQHRISPESRPTTVECHSLIRSFTHPLIVKPPPSPSKPDSVGHYV